MSSSMLQPVSKKDTETCWNPRWRIAGCQLCHIMKYVFLYFSIVLKKFGKAECFKVTVVCALSTWIVKGGTAELFWSWSLPFMKRWQSEGDKFELFNSDEFAEKCFFSFPCWYLPLCFLLLLVGCWPSVVGTPDFVYFIGPDHETMALGNRRR